MKTICQVKVSLKDVDPSVWRRILVDPEVSLDGLHRIIQACFGWRDRHLHAFYTDGKLYGDPLMLEMGEVIDEKENTFADLMPLPRTKIRYTYNFDARWEHTLLVEELLEAEPSVTYPRCVAGEYAAPSDNTPKPWISTEVAALDAAQVAYVPVRETSDFLPSMDSVDLEHINSQFLRLSL